MIVYASGKDAHIERYESERTKSEDILNVFSAATCLDKEGRYTCISKTLVL